MELIITILKVSAIAIVGWMLLLIFLGVLFTGSAELSTSKAECEDEQISAHCDELRYRRIKLLNEIGVPRDNGRFDVVQNELWSQVNKLKADEESFLSGTEVINMDPLGHKVGRVYKR